MPANTTCLRSNYILLTSNLLYNTLNNHLLLYSIVLINALLQQMCILRILVNPQNIGILSKVVSLENNGKPSIHYSIFRNVVYPEKTNAFS